MGSGLSPSPSLLCLICTGSVLREGLCSRSYGYPAHNSPALSVPVYTPMVPSGSSCDAQPGGFLWPRELVQAAAGRQMCQGVNSPRSSRQPVKDRVSRFKNGGFFGWDNSGVYFSPGVSNRAKPQVLRVATSSRMLSTLASLAFLSHFLTLLPVPSGITSEINLMHIHLCLRVFLLRTPA